MDAKERKERGEGVKGGKGNKKSIKKRKRLYYLKMSSQYLMRYSVTTAYNKTKVHNHLSIPENLTFLFFADPDL